MLPLHLLGAVLLSLAYLPLEEDRLDPTAIRDLPDEYRILRLLTEGVRLRFSGGFTHLRGQLVETRHNLIPNGVCHNLREWIFWSCVLCGNSLRVL